MSSHGPSNPVVAGLVAAINDGDRTGSSRRWPGQAGS